MVRSIDDECARWFDEAHAMGNGLETRDFDMAGRAELPHELSHHCTAAKDDMAFQALYQEWYEYLFEGDDQCLLMATEQSCSEGMLLPWDMRAVRLRSAPPKVRAQLHWLLGACLRPCACGSLRTSASTPLKTCATGKHGRSMAYLHSRSPSSSRS